MVDLEEVGTDVVRLVVANRVVSVETDTNLMVVTKFSLSLSPSPKSFLLPFSSVMRIARALNHYVLL